jgi:hypothetical protein
MNSGELERNQLSKLFNWDIILGCHSRDCSDPRLNSLGKRNTTPVNLLDSVPKIPFSHFVIFVKAPVIYLIIYI